MSLSVMKHTAVITAVKQDEALSKSLIQAKKALFLEEIFLSFIRLLAVSSSQMDE